MSRACFLDTSAWLAAVSEREARHDAVLACYERELQEGTRFITTNLVIAEMHILIARHRSAGDAVSFEVMRRERLKVAFALDRHFLTAGFELAP